MCKTKAKSLRGEFNTQSQQTGAQIKNPKLRVLVNNLCQELFNNNVNQNGINFFKGEAIAISMGKKTVTDSGQDVHKLFHEAGMELEIISSLLVIGRLTSRCRYK